MNRSRRKPERFFYGFNRTLRLRIVTACVLLGHACGNGRQRSLRCRMARV